MSIKNILMSRDNMSATEADKLIADARKAMNEYLMDGDTESAYYVCSEYFGLEPDYLMELM
jgi:hypothetical protein